MNNRRLRAQLKERLQQRWFCIVAQISGLDHLSRLRIDISTSPSLYIGMRQGRTTLAQLRLGTCNSNFSRSRLQASVNEGAIVARETFNHECSLYRKPWAQMLSTIPNQIMNSITMTFCSVEVELSLLLNNGKWWSQSCRFRTTNEAQSLNI